MPISAANNAKGFTLIEMMIVVAIIGIIAAVAVPQYRQYIVKGNRAAAQTFMLDVASREQQYLLDARSYFAVATDADWTTYNVAVPTEVSKYYTVTVSAPVVAGAAPTYTITAAPIAGKAQDGDGSLTLDDAGNKTPSSYW
jgi:type IV pilus assembly protein PilE